MLLIEEERSNFYVLIAANGYPNMQIMFVLRLIKSRPVISRIISIKKKNRKKKISFEYDKAYLSIRDYTRTQNSAMVWKVGENVIIQHRLSWGKNRIRHARSAMPFISLHNLVIAGLEITGAHWQHEIAVANVPFRVHVHCMHSKHYG